MLFRSNINVFSAFTISHGPLYVERVFDSLLTRSGVRAIIWMTDAERYERCLTYLKGIIGKSTCKDYAFIQFYMGYFYQRLSEQPEKANSRLHFQEKALCYYQCFLDLPTPAIESRFYALWQAGMLQEELGYSWQQAEVSLLSATESDPVRGESTSAIVRHYIRNRDWETAYIYSQIAVNQFFDRNPIASRRWFVDFNAYNWMILNTHFTVCYKLGYLKETKATYDRLLRYELDYLPELKDCDIRRIHSLTKVRIPYRESTNI